MTQGGKREGAGRKPSVNRKQPIAFKLDPEIVAYLRSRENATATMEELVLRSKGFREWRREREED